jgi:hypothetical protein
MSGIPLNTSRIEYDVHDGSAQQWLAQSLTDSALKPGLTSKPAWNLTKLLVYSSNSHVVAPRSLGFGVGSAATAASASFFAFIRRRWYAFSRCFCSLSLFFSFSLAVSSLHTFSSLSKSYVLFSSWIGTNDCGRVCCGSPPITGTETAGIYWFHPSSAAIGTVVHSVVRLGAAVSFFLWQLLRGIKPMAPCVLSLGAKRKGKETVVKPRVSYTEWPIILARTFMQS